MTKRADAALIGAGPAGLAAAAYLARAGWKTVIIDKNSPGGTARQLELIENYPGFPDGIPGKELMRRFVRQARRWGARFVRARARGVRRRGSDFAVGTTAGNWECRALLLCSGARFKDLGLANEKTLEGILHGAFDEAPRLRGRDVAVAGGGEAAVHQALLLSRYAREVTLICRGPALKAMRRLQSALLRRPNIRTLTRSVVAGLRGKKKLAAVLVRDLKTGKISRLKTSSLFVLIGKTPRTGLSLFRKKSPGFFSAGDIHSGRFRQTAIAAGDGIRAAMACEKYLRGNR